MFTVCVFRFFIIHFTFVYIFFWRLSNIFLFSMQNKKIKWCTFKGLFWSYFYTYYWFFFPYLIKKIKNLIFFPAYFIFFFNCKILNNYNCRDLFSDLINMLKNNKILAVQPAIHAGVQEFNSKPKLIINISTTGLKFINVKMCYVY